MDAPSSDYTTPNMALTGKEVLSGVCIQDIEELAEQNPSLRGYLHGYIAELFLKRHLESLHGISKVEKIPDRDSRKGDFLVTYLNHTLTVEAKSLSSNDLRQDLLNDSWIGRVNLKKTGAGKIPDTHERTTCLMRGEFDVLAICTFSLTKTWEFVFLENRYIPSSGLHEDRLISTITLDIYNQPKVSFDAISVFDEFIRSPAKI